MLKQMLKKVVLAVLALCLAGCGESPTGRYQFKLLPAEQVAAMGLQAFAAFKRNKPIETNPRINNYVRCVAQVIIGELPSDGTHWEVAVFRDPAVNAFALPGGKIGINTGLLEVANSADQLAAVIGHEVGHVLADHSNERLSQEFAMATLLNLLYRYIGNPESIADDIAMQALGLGSQLGVLLPYSRAHETEADIIGLDLMAQAGFDPGASLTLWQNMARTVGGQPPEILSTHPSPKTRLKDLENHMSNPMATYQEGRSRGKKTPCTSFRKT
jgi:predicted Zn-dependent protease